MPERGRNFRGVLSPLTSHPNPLRFATGDKLTVGGWIIRYVEGVKESISGLHSLDLDVSALPDSELDESLRDSGE